ncbi:MAG: antitoxin YefM [Phenylobacterium sp.]|jgi:antitoxin YefM
MNTLSMSEVRADFKSTVLNVIDNHEPILITNQGLGNVVMMSQEDYQSMQETMYLLSTTANAHRLNRSVEQIRANSFDFVQS